MKGESVAYYPATEGARGDDGERDALHWARQPGARQPGGRQPAPGQSPLRYPEAGSRPGRRRAAWPVRLLRWASGIVAGGIVALALAVGLVAFLAEDWEIAGPGAASVAWHAIGALIAVAAQIAADRAHGLGAVAWSVLVLTTGAVVLLTQWWS
ncbi:hypothetical protein HT102_15000 [Hoyosella sp. G463]|uniref:Uncharacterized protein n=1 Tax=Lolliginicoccus lacisalsi TaxID=2742202 RepID=A0A927JF11_9ACTN|nr:hypothetical protein [Lolliginicoccus lacisalsi]MBD8507795.1 hypothetical protein [Lolliginicoccus lacisalsi]